MDGSLGKGVARLDGRAHQRSRPGRGEIGAALDVRLFTNGWLWGAVGICLLLQAAAVYVRFLQAVLRTVPLNGPDWGLIAACSLAPIGVVEMVKVMQRGNGS